jgi:hypothetical protein
LIRRLLLVIVELILRLKGFKVQGPGFGGEGCTPIDGWKMESFIRSAFGCSMAWNVPLGSSCPNLITADHNRACGRIAKTMAPALLDFLNPELPNPET